MSPRKIIAVDVDDVVADLISEWLRYYNNDYNDNVTVDDIKSWNIHEYVKCGIKIYDYLDKPRLYDTVIPVENSIWGVNTLREMSYRVVFVTSTNINQNGQKLMWLQKYTFLPNQVKFERDYVEAVDKSLVYCDYLIDDKPDNIINSRGKGLLFTRPHNQDSKLLRVENWYDVIKFFTNEKYD